ncbi:restriction endonuclease [Actinomycetes bacterium KLBMP 9797]
MDGVPFEELARADLQLDGYLFGGRAGNTSDDPVGRVVRVGNQGGFRFGGSWTAGTVRLVALCSSGRDPDWPDVLDEQTGVFTYFGDNKKPGRDLHATRGNVLLREVFAACYGTPDQRRRLPPFLLFVNTGTYRDVRFRGLLAPGALASNPDDDLQAIWRSRDELRFQNYRARFTVLDVPAVRRAWLDEVLAGDVNGSSCPPAWRAWIEGRAYQPLTAQRTTTVRSRATQTPPDRTGAEILQLVRDWFAADPHQFEQCAVQLWRMIAPATGQVEVTPRSRDGGRDAVGDYVLGPAADPVRLDFALEAKCYADGNSVGVREMSRLISRLRHRMFGVFVTTSHFDAQAYREVRDDSHPIILICGRDIVDALRSHGHGTPAAVRGWLANNFPHPPAA